MLELLKRAILPVLSLVNAIKQWKEIRNRLADTPRKRISQHEKTDFLEG
jgi:hypothetical protein